jgi:hypothetical protein
MDNVQNCDSYISIKLSHTYRCYYIKYSLLPSPRSEQWALYMYSYIIFYKHSSLHLYVCPNHLVTDEA